MDGTRSTVTIETAAIKAKHRRTLIAAGFAFVLAVIIAFVALLNFGAAREAQYAQAALATRAPATYSYLTYKDPRGLFIVTVQRVSIYHHDAEFVVTVAQHNGAHVDSWTFAMSGAIPSDGKTYILHCKFNGKFYPVSAALTLFAPMSGAKFTSGGVLALDLGRIGTFTMTPTATRQGN